MQVRCGSSGFDYDPWVGTFYPRDLPRTRRLQHYASKLPTVEINYTFASLPSERAVAGWAAQTPEGFRFALKAWRRITHHRRLIDCEAPLAEFWRLVRPLGDKLGPVLFQLPPNLRRDDALLAAFLRRLPKAMRAAFEFRHPSWLDETVFGRLRRHRAALCIADDEELTAPRNVATADFTYLRLRRDRYSPRALAPWAAAVGSLPVEEAYVFFKHEESGRAPKLARKFAQMCKSTS